MSSPNDSTPVTQPTTAPDGAAPRIAPAAAAAEATTIKSQSITAAEAQVASPAPTDVASHSGGTIVPTEFRFTETQYEPTADVTSEELSKLSQDDLLTGLKKQYSSTRDSFERFGRDLSTLVKFYDAVVALCSCERVSKNRNGKPTLQEAFSAIGWNYEAARKMKQRYNASIAGLPTYASPPKPLQLAEGDKVKAGNGTEGTVQNVHESAAKVDVVFEGRDEAVTILTAELTKVVLSVKKIQVGDLILCQDNGTEYEYDGQGKFSRTKTPTALERKRARELAAIEAKQERERAKAEEKERQKELRKAEAARRDLDKIEKAKAEKEAKAKKRAEAKAARAKKLADKAGTKSAAAKAIKTKRVKVARIGNTREFGVYPESCMIYDNANATTIGTQQYCEAERDRINNKGSSSVSDLATEKAADEAKAQKEAVEVL